MYIRIASFPVMTSSILTSAASQPSYRWLLTSRLTKTELYWNAYVYNIAWGTYVYCAHEYSHSFHIHYMYNNVTMKPHMILDSKLCPHKLNLKSPYSLQMYTVHALTYILYICTVCMYILTYYSCVYCSCSRYSIYTRPTLAYSL